MTEEEKRILLEEEEKLRREEALVKERMLEMELSKKQAEQARFERNKIIRDELGPSEEEKRRDKRKKWIIGLAIFFGLGIIGQFFPDEKSAKIADIENTKAQQENKLSFDDYKAQLKQELSDMQKAIQENIGKMNLEAVEVEEKNGSLTLSMQDILFKSGSAKIGPELKISLAKIAGVLSVNNNVNIEVQGHTDNTGDSQKNQKLSELRAKNVAAFLSEQGIAKDRLTFKGFGDTQPIADNTTEEGKKKNRRVDLVIVDK